MCGRRLRRAVAFGIGVTALAGVASAAEGEPALRFANVFNDHMVLQQAKPLKVWGWAKPGAQVTVTITESGKEALALAGKEALERPEPPRRAAKGEKEPERRVSVRYVEENAPAFSTQQRSAQADQGGLWQAAFDPIAANLRPKFLIATSGQERVAFRDILVGEVWLCSGQSNMEWGVQADTEWGMEGKCADFPAVRYCDIGRKASPAALDDLAAGQRNWARLSQSNEHLARVSAVSFYFAVRLHRYLKVPVGIVHNAWGGTTAETWTSRRTLEAMPQLKKLLAHWDKRIADWPQERQRRLAEHAKRVAKAKAAGKKPPRAPRLGDGPIASRNLPGGCFNALIWPIRRLALRGALFFQGENNSIGRWGTYRHSFPKLIECWRATFGDAKLPFGIISLMGFGPHGREMEPESVILPPGTFWYAAIRDIHFRTFRATPHTALIVTWDLGDTAYIHPARKRGVGERAARWALARVYGKPVIYTAPVYREMKVEGSKIKLHFDTDPGIKTVLRRREGQVVWWLDYPITRAGREYRGLLIAGEDRHFYPAQARRGKEPGSLKVWSEHVPKPAAVRYGWSGYPDGNLIGHDWLPVHPFRTDDWPLLEQPPYDRTAREQWNAKVSKLRERASRWAWQRKLQEARSLLAKLVRDSGRLVGEEAREALQRRIEQVSGLMHQLEGLVAKKD